MGGLIGIKNNKDIYQLIKGNCISFEGFITYGGLSGRDLEALAIGLYEGIDEEYLKYRNASMEYLASQLLDAGVAIKILRADTVFTSMQMRCSRTFPTMNFPAIRFA